MGYDTVRLWEMIDNVTSRTDIKINWTSITKTKTSSKFGTGRFFFLI